MILKTGKMSHYNAKYNLKTTEITSTNAFTH